MTIRQFPADSAERKVMGLATSTVFAVANARIRGDIDDADTIYEHYLQDALAAGVPLAMAWTLLSSAAINEFTTAITVLAVEQDVPTEVALGDAAIAYAQEACG